MAPMAIPTNAPALNAPALIPLIPGDVAFSHFVTSEIKTKMIYFGFMYYN